jgi:hypothetical protein
MLTYMLQAQQYYPNDCQPRCCKSGEWHHLSLEARYTLIMISNPQNSNAWYVKNLPLLFWDM